MRYFPILFVLGLLFLSACDTTKQVPTKATTPTTKADFIIKNVNLFDGNQLINSCNVAVKDGLFHAIYTDEKNITSDSIIDGTGKTIIPGLINAHVHAWFPNHLKDAAQAGVMAVFDLHGGSVGMNYLVEIRDTVGWADYYRAGPGATVEGGHGTQFGMAVPMIGKELTAEQYVLDRVEEKVDFIKILREPSMNTIGFEQIDTVIQVAKKHNLTTVSHISIKDDALEVAALGADGLAHIWWDKAIETDELTSLKTSGAFVTPTMVVVEKALEIFQKRDSTKQYLSFEAIINEVRKLHEAGVTLLAGTDPPNFGLNHGTDLYQELYYFVEAGLSPLEALRTATGNISEAFGMEEIGWVKEGNRASFSLIDGDPTVEIKDLEKMEMIWQKGVVLKNDER